MSLQIKEIIEKNIKLLLGREEELRAYLLKYFENAFKEGIIEKFERIDATDRIKKAGFQKNLSSWRNTYKNIVISSCTIVNGAQKRFDYKFYFVEEKLNEKTIEIIEDALKESSRLKNRFQFEEAVAKVDEMIELIRKEEDRVYNKRLIDFRKEIFDAEKDYNKLLQKLANLEGEIKINQEKDNLQALINNCQEIIPITKKVRRSDLVRKYTTILEDAERELNFRNELAKLEREFKHNRSIKNLEKALTICENIIELCEKNNKIDLVDKYQKNLEQLKREIKDVEEAKKREQEELKRLEDSTVELINLSRKGIAFVNKNKYYDAFEIYKTILTKMEE